MFDLGSSLRDARERKRLTFADLEQVTKVRAKYLRALEEDDFQTLPGPTYVRGFLRVYAEALGLDGQLYVDEYNSRYASGDEDPQIRPRQVAPARPVRWVERNAVVLALVTIVVVTAGVVGAWKFVPGDDDGGTVAPAATAARAGAARVTAARLSLTARADTFLEVRETEAGGRLLFQGTLERGETQDFTAARLWLNVGSPVQLRATVNGIAVTLPGGKGPTLMAATANGIAAVARG